jgi:hypothetical protein
MMRRPSVDKGAMIAPTFLGVTALPGGLGTSPDERRASSANGQGRDSILSVNDPTPIGETAQNLVVGASVVGRDRRRGIDETGHPGWSGS